MTARIHGHEVMQMMIASQKAYTKASLCEAIVTEYGTDTRFYTCSADNLTASELVDFLESKGKFVAVDAGFTTQKAKMCHH